MNIIYDMLCFTFYIQEQAERISGSIRSLAKISAFLDPMKKATEVMSSEKHCTASLILPLKHSLLEKTIPNDSCEDGDPAVISVMKSLFYNDLKDR